MFLGECLRTLNDGEYVNLESQLPAIAHAWNTTRNASLNCSPFEIHHGVKARSIPEAALALTNESVAVPEVLESVRNHTNFYIRLASDHGKFMSKLRSKKLNATKTQVPLKLGEKVMIYVPPSMNQANARNRRVKHCLHFRGPATITKWLGSNENACEVKMDNSNAVFQRTLINVKRFPEIHFTKSKKDMTVNEHGTVVDASGTVFHFGTLTPGTIIALIDNEGDRKFRLGKVTKHAGDWHTVHLHAAQLKGHKRSLRQRSLLQNCVYKLGHIDSNDNTIVFNARHKPWIMQFDTREKLVIAINLELYRNKLTAESLGQIPQGFAPILS